MKQYYLMVIIATIYLIAVTATITVIMGKQTQLEQTAQNNLSKQMEEARTLCTNPSNIEVTEDYIKIDCGE